MKCQSLFSVKIKKNIISLSSAELELELKLKFANDVRGLQINRGNANQPMHTRFLPSLSL